MTRHALKIISDGASYFRWVIMGVADNQSEFQHSEAPCEFHSYEAALNEGLQALQAADAENQAANPQAKGSAQH